VSKKKKLTRFKFSDLEGILPIEVSTFLYNKAEAMDMPKADWNFFSGLRGQDTAFDKAGLRGKTLGSLGTINPDDLD
jgi:hypothetical protein